MGKILLPQRAFHISKYFWLKVFLLIWADLARKNAAHISGTQCTMQDNSNFRLAGHLITFHSISIPLRTGIQFHWNHHLPSLLGSHPLTVLDLSTSTSTLLPSIFMPSACLYAAENSQFHNFVPYVPYGPRWVAMPLSSKNIVSLWSKCSIHLDFKQKEKATFKESWCYKGPVSCDSLSSQSIRGLFFRWSAEGFCLVLFDDSEPP